MDGITGVVAAHEGHALQFLNHEHAFVVDQGVGTGESGLADGQLFLVEAGIGGVEVGIGVLHLGNFASEFHFAVVEGVFGVHGAFVDLVHLALFVVSGSFPAHPGAIAAIAGVGGDDGAVGGGFLAHHDAGAIGTDALFVFVLCHRVQTDEQKSG